MFSILSSEATVKSVPSTLTAAVRTSTILTKFLKYSYGSWPCARRWLYMLSWLCVIGLKAYNDLLSSGNSYNKLLDKFCFSRMGVGNLKEVIGHRVHVRYADIDGDDLANSCWCHEQSDGIKVVGWSKTVDHDILAPTDYNPPEIGKISVMRQNPGINIQIGMKLEAVDQLKLSTISSATVVRVLKHGYFMVHIDSTGPVNVGGRKSLEGEEGSNWYCFHITSTLIFPCGFCKKNNTELLPPVHYDAATLDWDDYFKDMGCKPLPLNELDKELIDHGFTEGAKLEAVDVMEPHYICVATVQKVVGRLLRIRFDGWGASYDQCAGADATSCVLIPIGWCQLMIYSLQPPHVEQRQTGLKSPGDGGPDAKRVK